MCSSRVMTFLRSENRVLRVSVCVKVKLFLPIIIAPLPFFVLFYLFVLSEKDVKKGAKEGSCDFT